MTDNPYWIAQNARLGDIDLASPVLALFTTQEVRENKSPLGREGIIFSDTLRMRVSVQDLIWIFPKELRANSEVSYRIADLFRFIHGTASEIHLSRAGLIRFLEDEEPVKQPPNPRTIEVARIIDFDLDIAVRSYDLACLIAKFDKKEAMFFRQLFEHLYELRCASPFIGQLGIWGFIEHEWADDKTKTSIHNSLSSLVNSVYSDEKLKRKIINKRIERIGTRLGKEYNENILRNILAHGKHYTLNEGWSDQDWNDFHEIHDELFELVSKGLDQKIRTRRSDQRR